MSATTEAVLMIVELLLEDVAQKPTRLARAQQLARQQIPGIIEELENIKFDAARERFVRRLVDLALRKSMKDQDELQLELRAALNLGRLGSMQFPNIELEYEIRTCPYGKTVHRGTFRLADHHERRAFAVRVHQAQLDGFEVRTRRADIPQS